MKNPRLPLLIGAIALVALSGVLYSAGALPAARLWLLLAGAVLALLFFVIGGVSRAPAQRAPESMLFEDDASAAMDLRDGDGKPRG